MSKKIAVGPCVFDCLVEVLGRPATVALLGFAGMEVEDIVEDPKRFVETLGLVFGPAAGQLEKTLARSLTRRFGLAADGYEPSFDEAVHMVLTAQLEK